MANCSKSAESVRPAITNSELDLPLSKSSLDGLDLAIVGRSAIEVQLGHTLSDELWFASNTLAEIIETQMIRIEIGMPQMAANGLSENWLFRYCGDLHWQELCKSMGVLSRDLTNDAGERLYATFVAIAARL